MITQKTIRKIKTDKEILQKKKERKKKEDNDNNKNIIIIYKSLNSNAYKNYL